MKEKLDKYVKDTLLDLCDLFDLPVSKANTRKVHSWIFHFQVCNIHLLFVVVRMTFLAILFLIMLY